MKITNGKELETRIEKVERPTTLQKWIESNKNIIKTALPKGFTPERMIRILMSTTRNNPILLTCTRISFISAVMQSIQLGLEPNTVLGQAYLIPYYNSKLKCREVQFQIGYKGLLEMAYRTREFKEIYALEVYSGDYFEFVLGTEKYIKHIPTDNPDLDKNNKPIVTHVYAVYKNVKGGMHFVVWTRDKLERHKEKYVQAFKKGAKKGEADRFSAWMQSPIAMYKKTVLKDLLKYADISVEFRRKLEVDETVKREIRPDMIEVKPVYEYDANDLGKAEEVKLEEKLEEKKEKKEVKGKPKSEVKSKLKEPKKPEIAIIKPTKSELSLMSVKRAGAGYTKEEFAKYLLDNYKAKTPMQLTKKQYDEIIKFLDKKIEEDIEKQGKLID